MLDGAGAFKIFNEVIGYKKCLKKSTNVVLRTKNETVITKTPELKCI